MKIKRNYFHIMFTLKSVIFRKDDKMTMYIFLNNNNNKGL